MNSRIFISFNPRKRPKIDEILKDKWFGNIPNMTEEELKNYEKEIKMEEEFKNRKIEVDNKSKDEIKKNNDESNKIYIKTHPTKSIGDEKDDFFNSELICKNVESEKYMNYYQILLLKILKYIHIMIEYLISILIVLKSIC